jgi:hypothetical protein
MITTTHILNWTGLTLLIVGLAYRAGGWRNYWATLKQPMSLSRRVPLDPRYSWWANPMTWLGFGLLVLSYWRSWRGL